MGSTRSSSALRTFAGGIVGAVTAAICSVGAFLVFLPLPPATKTHDYTREVLLGVALASFLAGAFVGRRGIYAQHASELGWTAGGVYAVLIFLSSSASLSVAEAATIIGLISVGLLIAGRVVLSISKRFPIRPDAQPGYSSERADSI